MDFLITLGLMAVMMIWYRFVPDWRLLAVRSSSCLAFGASFGIGLWLCALNVEYRDFRYIVPFIVQFGLYVSPVGFSSGVVPAKWRLLYSLNPMVGVIDGFRWALLRGQTPALVLDPRRFHVADILCCASAASGISARWNEHSPMSSSLKLTL